MFLVFLYIPNEYDSISLILVTTFLNPSVTRISADLYQYGGPQPQATCVILGLESGMYFGGNIYGCLTQSMNKLYI